MRDIKKINMSLSIFFNNTALSRGGGIYHECSSPYNCSMNVLSDNYFTNNYAGLAGGALYWNDIEPT